jgi:hypothetical protein
MSNHKQALKDLIVNFIHNCTSENKEEKEFELKYGDESLQITIKARSMLHEQWAFGNRLIIESSNYEIELEETERQYMNLPTLWIEQENVLIKSPSYVDMIDILNSIKFVLFDGSWRSRIYIPELKPKYLVLVKEDIHTYVNKVNWYPETTIIYNCMFDDFKENIDIINQIKCKHFMIQMWPYNLIAADKFLSLVSKINHPTIIFLDRWFADMKKYIDDNLLAFVNCVNLASIQYEDDTDEIKEAYSIEKYLDRLNLRRLQLHYRKLTIAHHPMLNRDTLKLIESFLF